MVEDQCFDRPLTEHNKCSVLVVDIPKASGVKYMLSTNDTYIRSETFPLKMAPSEMQIFPVERGALTRDLSAAEIGYKRRRY